MFIRRQLRMDEADLLGASGGAPPPEAPPEGGSPNLELVQEGWLKGVEAELANHTSMGNIKDINALAKSFIHGQKLVGKDRMIVPDEHASAEDWQAIYDKLGRPTRDNYKVEFGEASYGDEFKKGFIDKAHAQGLMPQQAQEMFNYWNGEVSTATEESSKRSQEAIDESINSLKKEWGNGFDKNLAVAQQTINQFADQDFKDYLTESGLTHDVNIIKFLNKIGGALNEDTFKRDTVKHLGMTKEDAQEKINSIMGDKAHPYWDKTHINHKYAAADMQKYYDTLE